MKKKDRELYRMSLYNLGFELQETILMEECAEVVQAICKLRRHGRGFLDLKMNMVEELVDLRIMLEQMEVWYADLGLEEDFEHYREMKLDRLRGLVKKAKEAK